MFANFIGIANKTKWRTESFSIFECEIAKISFANNLAYDCLGVFFLLRPTTIIIAPTIVFANKTMSWV